MTQEPLPTVCGAGLALPLPDPALMEADLELRPWGLADGPALAAAWLDPEVARWTGVPRQHDLAAAERWIAGDAARRQRGLSLDLVIAIGPTVVGEVGLARFDPVARTADAGWWLAPDHRRQGRVAQAVRLLSEWALQELCIDGLVARCHRGNPASGAVAAAAGYEGPASDPGDPEVAIWRFGVTAAPGRISP